MSERERDSPSLRPRLTACAAGRYRMSNRRPGIQLIRQRVFALQKIQTIHEKVVENIRLIAFPDSGPVYVEGNLRPSHCKNGNV